MQGEGTMKEEGTVQGEESAEEGECKRRKPCREIRHSGERTCRVGKIRGGTDICSLVRGKVGSAVGWTRAPAGLPFIFLMET
jgi:hypothetical protein